MGKNRIITFESYKAENESIIPFLDLIDNEKEDIFLKIPDSDGSQKMPDFVVPGKYLIETKRLCDFNEVKTSSSWGLNINKLQKNINKIVSNINLDGFYLVETPRNFKVKNQKQLDELSDKIIKSIIDKKDKVDYGVYSLPFKKISSKDVGITFSTSWGGSINPAGTIFQNLRNLLKKADIQLKNGGLNYSVEKKVLLIINNYAFADRISEMIEGLSYCYNDLITYENIDEIWFQNKSNEGIFTHTKIYSADFLKKFNIGKIKANDKTHQEQFELWYWALEKLDDEKSKLFQALKLFLANKKPKDIFTDPYKRETMARLGLWLIDQNRVDDAIWLIEKFIDDPDPADPKNYTGDPKFNYDKEIKDGKDPIIISTVMGHLAWVVQSLARKSTEKNPKNLIKSFQFTERVILKTKNLYVIQQWLIPLVEITNRRFWILDSDPSRYKDFRKLLLDRKTGIVAKYSKYPAIAKYLVHIFAFFKDLNNSEVKFVLEKLFRSDEVAPILIYFAIYRPLHYKQGSEIAKSVLNIDKTILNYNGKFAHDLLKNAITGKNQTLKGNIAWQLWKILDEDRSNFDKLKEYIDIMISQPYERDSFVHLTHLLEDNISYHPDECIPWLNMLLSNVNDYGEKVGWEQASREIFINFRSISWLKKNRPKNYSVIKDKLNKLGEKKVFIGHLE